MKFDPNGFIDNLKDKVFAVHIHENNGKIDEHTCPKEGDWSLNVVDNYFKDRDIPIVLMQV